MSLLNRFILWSVLLNTFTVPCVVKTNFAAGGTVNYDYPGGGANKFVGAIKYVYTMFRVVKHRMWKL
jgi:hypothetical protein